MSLSFMWVAINGTALLVWLQVVCTWKDKKRMRCINILIMKMYHINFSNISNISKHQNADQSVHNCPEKISYLFKFIQFSTRRYTHYKWVNWYSTEKIVLIFLHQRWLGLAVMGKYHSELLMLFRRWLYSHASIAVAFSDLVIMNMLISGTQGP